MAVSAPVPQPTTPASTSIGSSAANPSSSHDVRSILADNNCVSCHQIRKYGGAIGPSLNGVGTRLTQDQLEAVILHPPAKTRAGVPNSMPSYSNKITGDDLTNLVHYLSTLPQSP